MRAYRKRPWSSLVMNVTPLIDVIFLLIIFFLLTINFSEVIMRRVTLPKADEARELRQFDARKISVTIRSDHAVFVGLKSVPLQSLDDGLEEAFRELSLFPRNAAIMLLADQNVDYEVVQTAMQKIALLGVTRIEFSTLKDAVPPFGKE